MNKIISKRVLTKQLIISYKLLLIEYSSADFVSCCTNSRGNKYVYFDWNEFSAVHKF